MGLPIRGADRRPGRANTSTGPGVRLLRPVWLPGMLGGFPQGSPSGELNWGRKKALVSPGEGEWRSKHDTGQFFPPITYPTHGKKLAQRGDCRILWRCLPARSSADVCQRGAVRQRMGGGNTPGGVSPHPQGARLTLRLVRQGDGLHYPVGQPLFGDRLPFLLPSVADKELITCGLARACPTAVAGTAVRLNALPTALGSWCAKSVGALSRAPRLPARCM